MRIVRKCSSCETEYVLSYSESIVKEYQPIFCPFCADIITDDDEETPEDDE